MKERNGQLRYLSIVIGAFLSVGVIVGLTNNLYSLYVIPMEYRPREMPRPVVMGMTYSE